MSQESRALLQADDPAVLIEEVPFPMMRVQEGGRVLYANGAALAVPGLLKDSSDIYLVKSLVHTVSNALKTDRTRIVEFSSRTRIFELTITPASNKSHANIFGRDVTEECVRDRAAYSVPSFCQAHDFGRAKVYEEIKSGRLRIMKVGKRTLISAESAADWRKLMEGAELDPPPKGSPRRAGETDNDDSAISAR